VASLVIGVLIVAPALLFLLQIAVLLPLRNGRVIPHFVPCMRLLSKLNHWLMFDVFMLAIIVAVVKLTSLADVTAGPGLWAFCALMLASTASLRSYDVHLVWARYDELTSGQGQRSLSLPQSPLEGRSSLTAMAHGMACCDICGLLNPCPHPGARCRRCANLLQPRKPDSLNRTWALLLAGYVLFIPANLLPITITSSLFGVQADTIMSGVVYFWHSGAYDLAIIIFVASVFVPLGKLLALSYLAYSAQVRTVWQPQQRTRLYRMVEFVGKWSMLDVFVVAMLAQLVQFSSLAAIEAGPGAIAFSAVVVVTMFAAMAFDPRLIWDPLESDSPAGAKSD
jgi:paraquat-inducible protein A